MDSALIVQPFINKKLLKLPNTIFEQAVISALEFFTVQYFKSSDQTNLFVIISSLKSFAKDATSATILNSSNADDEPNQHLI